MFNGMFTGGERAKKLTAREIAKCIRIKHPKDFKKKFDKSNNCKIIEIKKNTDGEILTDVKAITAVEKQITAEISSHYLRKEKDSGLKRTEDCPYLYYWIEKSDENEVTVAESDENSPASTGNPSPIKEHDLYPILGKFLGLKLKISSKRINEKTSINSKGKGGNNWLHPDIVGLEILSDGWNKDVKNFFKECGYKKVNFWSFEVKTSINSTNVRKAFFQTVSNSSWANFAYLVAAELDRKILEELRMLASLHGIGFIQLNVDNPKKSQIMIPAKERSDIDWDTTNRLAVENSDFLKYIDQVCDFYLTSKTNVKLWGNVPNPKEG